MLTRFHKILLIALAVQLVLIAVVMTRGNDTGALKERPILAGFDAAKVTRLQIVASDPAKPGEIGKPLDLVKRDANWVMASGFDYPVAQTKVTDALSPIAKISAAAPLASQASRHKQLKVADTDFERKVTITADGKDVTLFIGGPAGARRTAVRLGGDERVYAVTGLSIATLTAEPRTWIDPGYVKVPKEEIAKVVIQRDGRTIELARQAPPAPPAGAGSGSGSGAGSGSGDGSGSAAAEPPWTAQVAGAPISFGAGESLDEGLIDRLVSQVATLDLSAPADPKRDASKPTATITIERKASGTTTASPTVVDVIADGESFWVHDRSSPRAGTVDKYRLEDVVALDRDRLVKKPAPPAPKGAPPAGAGAEIPGLPPGMTLPPGVTLPPPGGAPHPH